MDETHHHLLLPLFSSPPNHIAAALTTAASRPNKPILDLFSTTGYPSLSQIRHRLAMKRRTRLDSLIPIYPSEEEKVAFGGTYSARIMDAMEEEEEEEQCGDEEMLCGVDFQGGGGGGEKKRRLSAEQVLGLENNFEVGNKLEPERKLRLAQELGLQPRQVAVWFQNRRARWKTKQLERDYAAHKAAYDALRLDHDALCRDKDALLAQIQDLKTKLGEEEIKPALCAVKEESAASEEPPATAVVYKDGSSESDSSGILNVENSPRGWISSPAAVLQPPDSTMEMSNASLTDASVYKGEFFYQHPQLLKPVAATVEQEEPGSFCFSDEPMLSWYYSGEHWN